MITLPSGIKKVEASDNATIANQNRNDDLLDVKITKLDGIATGANNYVHPANHPPSIITQDASNRFVTDTEKTTWNAKASTSVATTGANGLMSATDKTKLDGVATGANNYTHPANHPPSIITQDASNRFVTDAEKTTWNGKASTAVATPGANGLMSASDKSKLDGLAYVAGTYTGNGTVTRDIALPFTPSAVLVMRRGSNFVTALGTVYMYGGLAVTGQPAGYTTYDVVTIGTNKFTVVYDATDVEGTNFSGEIYSYIAFK
ncbi:hypothetical protein [Paenibacillus sp. LPE1-1-1.1]|uniref:hypothetical protein n=1 Tax=Paenibacillus sp. LPE1-1-1.1 TaxID=3135230 RepID=UPI003438CEAC